MSQIVKYFVNIYMILSGYLFMAGESEVHLLRINLILKSGGQND